MSRLEEIKTKVNNTDEPMLYVPYADINWLISRVEELEEENKRYKQALEFYADENNYIHRDWEALKPNVKSLKMSMVDWDDGVKAREALKGESE